MITAYKWYKYNLNVSCDKCNHPIPFQSFLGNPTCSECGNIADKTWVEAVQFSNITKVKQYNEGSTQLAGFMQLQMNYNAVENINCFHCHHILETPINTAIAVVNCKNCMLQISFEKQDNEALKNLVFYFHSNEKEKISGNVISLHCVSCGAPLQTDTTKHEYNCNFCNTLNIIPSALRAKKILDDVYVGWNGKI